MNLSELTQSRIYRHMGEKADAFLSRAEYRLKKYTELWKLSDLAFLQTDTVNLLFSCKSALFGPSVFKLCIPGPEVATEIRCLEAYAGRGYCNLRAYDLSDDCLLLEHIIPGKNLWEIADYRERAMVFAETVKDLPLPYHGQGVFPTYLSWLERVHQTLSSRSGLEDVLFCLEKALDIYARLKNRRNRSCLLHGDLHQENLLQNPRGSYTIIDPKGVVDDPVMEPARFLLNEIPCAEDTIREMVSIMSPILAISEADMFCSLFVDAVLSGSWNLEVHYPTQEAFLAEKQRILEICGFAYGLLT